MSRDILKNWLAKSKMEVRPPISPNGWWRIVRNGTVIDACPTKQAAEKYVREYGLPNLGC